MANGGCRESSCRHEWRKPGVTKLLVSVTNVEEAIWALDAGVDIVDLKNPALGALGALPLDTVREIVRVIDGRKTVSATIGDLDMQPALLIAHVKEMAATGVDIVKVGFFPSSANIECINALEPLIRNGIKIVAVLPADLELDLNLLPIFMKAGFYGVMLDTFHKKGKSLVDYLSIEQLSQFVIETNSLGMQSGLAGSLQVMHIPSLKDLGAAYMGFRGAACVQYNRRAGIEPDKIAKLKFMLHKYNEFPNYGNVAGDSQAPDCNANAVSV